MNYNGELYGMSSEHRTELLIRQMSIESERTEHDESISFIEAVFEHVVTEYHVGDTILKGSVEGVVVGYLANDSKLRISLNTGTVEVVESEELTLVRRAGEVPQAETAVDYDDLDCSVCHDLICDPITISCGHTYCRLCLKNALERQPRCPLCRSPCSTNAVTHPTNIMVSNLCKKFFPSQYETKRAESQRQLAKMDRSSPIFYYNRYMYPGEDLQLCFYTDQYKLMHERIMQGDKQFIFLPCFRHNNLAQPGDIGLLCELKSCQYDLEQRVFTTSRAMRRVILTNTWSDSQAAGLWSAEYVYYDDDSTELTDVSRVKFEDNLYSELVELYDAIANPTCRPTHPAPPVSQISEAVWWCIQFLLLLQQIPNIKAQEILASKSLQQRLNIANETRHPSPEVLANISAVSYPVRIPNIQWH